MIGFERSLEQFFAWCVDRDDCGFAADAADAAGVAAAFDACHGHPRRRKPAPTTPGRPAADLGVANNAVAQALYASQFWPRSGGRVVDDAAVGDGNGLLALHDGYFDRQPDGTWQNTLEAFQVISCIDDPVRATMADEAQAALDVLRARRRGWCRAPWPRLPARRSRSGRADGDHRRGCGADCGGHHRRRRHPARRHPADGRHPRGRTTARGRRRAAHRLRRGNDRATTAVDAYLVSLVVPADETTCR